LPGDYVIFAAVLENQVDFPYEKGGFAADIAYMPTIWRPPTVASNFRRFLATGNRAQKFIPGLREPQKA